MTMKPLFAYPPLSAAALEAIAQIDRATTLKGLDEAYDVVHAEALRRTAGTVGILALAAAALGLVLGTARGLGWLDHNAIWPSVAGMPLLWIANFLLRGPPPLEDTKRLRDALDVWRVLKRRGGTSS